MKARPRTWNHKPLIQALLSSRAHRLPWALAPADQEAEIGIRSIAVPLVRFDGKAVAVLNIGVQPEQVSAKTLTTDYLPLLLKEAKALKERLV
jgi:IclR family transcriptional regulator, pca regulon regulatory protein